MKRTIGALAVVVSFLSIHAQQLVYTVGTPVIFQCKYGKPFNNVFVAAFNPALLPFIDGLHAGAYAEKKFMLREMQSLTLTACKGFDNSGISITAQQFGRGDYKQTFAALSYARRFGTISTGVEFRYVVTEISNAGRIPMLAVAVGSLIKVTGEMSLFLNVANPKFFQVKEGALRPASCFSFGTGWQVSSLVYVGIEVRKEQSRDLSIACALQHRMSGAVLFSLSWSVLNNQPYVCFAWQTQKITFEAGAGYHAMLGASPFVAAAIGKRNKEDGE